MLRNQIFDEKKDGRTNRARGAWRNVKTKSGDQENSVF